MGPGGGQHSKGDFNEYKVYVKPVGFKRELVGEVALELTEYQEATNGYKDGNGGKCQWITGYMEKFEKKIIKDDKNGKEYKALDVELVVRDHPNYDKPVRYIVQMFWTWTARDLINRMVSLAETVTMIDKPVTIGVYEMQTEKGINKGVYLKYGDMPNSSIKDQQSFKGKFAWKTLMDSKMDKVTVNGQIMNDYTRMDDFFIKCISEFIRAKVMPSTASQVPQNNPVGTPAPDASTASHAMEQRVKPEGFYQPPSSGTPTPPADFTPPPPTSDELGDYLDDLPF